MKNRQTKEVKLHPDCIMCLVNKYMKNIPQNLDTETKSVYLQRVLNMIANAPLSTTPPEIVRDVARLQKEMLGAEEDYTEIKKYFNALMLSKESEVMANIEKAKDPLYLALCYSMLGNYIDFGAMESVDEQKLQELFDSAAEIDLGEEYKNLKNELAKSSKLVFLTDNCGEVALDKMLVCELKKLYPKLDVQVIVRGYNVLNDATLDDALQVGFDKVANVSDNGSDVAGTCLDEISKEAREKIDGADLIIAKGQGNFETMRYCNRNVYYIFMCKCMMFAERFNVPRFSPMLLNDFRMK